MNRLLLSTLAVVTMSFPSLGAPLCTSVLGSNVATLNAGGGCELGPYLFDSFGVQDAAQAGGGPVLLVGTVQNPAVQVYTLIFSPQVGNPSASEDLHFNMRVSTLGGGSGIHAVGLSASGSGAGSHVLENVCDANGVDLGTGVCTNPGPLFSGTAFVGGSIPLTGIGGQSVVWTWKEIVSDAGGSVTQFTQSFQAVPEPVTFTMLSAGLLGLALLRRKRAS